MPKRERRPPKTWRRNMLAAAALLLVLDGAILAPGVNATKSSFALTITIVVLAFIILTWRANIRLEKAESANRQ